MCLFESCFILISSYKVKKKIGVPHNHIVPPEKILCLNCGEITRGVYYETTNRCRICLIPCCCSTLVEEPKMGCSLCETIFKINPKKCNNCEVYNMVSVKYCPNCGMSSMNNSL